MSARRMSANAPPSVHSTRLVNLCVIACTQDYHWLSQSAIDGGKRISQHLSGQTVPAHLKPEILRILPARYGLQESYLAVTCSTGALMSETKSAELLFASRGENRSQSSPPSASNANSAIGVMECEYFKAASGKCMSGDFIEK